MEYVSYKCDVCGRSKGASNHWFRAARVPGPRWTITPWELGMRDVAASFLVQHLCGLECASKAMQRAMAETPEEEKACGE